MVCVHIFYHSYLKYPIITFVLHYQSFDSMLFVHVYPSLRCRIVCTPFVRLYPTFGVQFSLFFDSYQGQTVAAVGGGEGNLRALFPL